MPVISTPFVYAHEMNVTHSWPLCLRANRLRAPQGEPSRVSRVESKQTSFVSNKTKSPKYERCLRALKITQKCAWTKRARFINQQRTVHQLLVDIIIYYVKCVKSRALVRASSERREKPTNDGMLTVWALIVWPAIYTAYIDKSVLNY